MKKYSYSLLILFICILSYSCKKGTNHSTENYTHTITIKDSLDIRLPGTIDIYFFKKDIDDDIFYGLQKNEIIKIDLKAKQFIGKIEVPSFYISSELSSIHVINKDSILVTDSPISFLLIDAKGEVLNKYTIAESSLLPENSQIFTPPSYIRLQEDGQHVYFPILHYAYLSRPWEYKKNNRIGVLNLTSEKVTKFIIPTAESAYIPKGYNYPDDVLEPNLTVVNNSIIVSYPYDNVIEVYDLSGEFKYRKKVSSQYISEAPKRMKIKTYKVHQKRWNHRITMPFYNNINFHEAIGLYSRIAYHEQPLKMNDGKLNDGSKRTASVILMDKNFNVVGETLFENGSLGVYKSIPLPDGYLIASNQKYWKHEDQFIFTTRLQIEKL
ncbi:DUF4221 family protein [Kordia sp. YSTF-M3]|uniref:DUF4221 family protein n=1 Tax=Kordia aestuariivivens TaxID=2759037 RepID=A0ABR7Q7G6_9FLAO|nr:DUF4221 family protein [Kordia aestuariivivens]MBC8754296.1 DUF4221 family protein [Kordia aestuariivivens]